MNVSSFLVASATRRFHYKTDSWTARFPLTFAIRNPFPPRPVNRIATFRGVSHGPGSQEGEDRVVKARDKREISVCTADCVSASTPADTFPALSADNLKAFGEGVAIIPSRGIRVDKREATKG